MTLSNDQAEKIAMFDRRRKNTTDNETLFFTSVVVKAKIVAIADVRKKLDAAVTLKLEDTSGDSPQKKAVKDLVIKTVGTKARACATYFEDNSQLDVAATLLRPKTYYDKQKDEDLATILKAVRKILNDNMDSLADYGVDAGFITTVDDQIKEWEKWSTAPTSAKEGKDAADADINKYIVDIDKMYGQLDSLIINAFEASEPEIVKAYLETGSIITIGVRHNTVELTIKSSTDNTGINRAKLTVTDPATGKELRIVFTDALGMADFYSQNKDLYAEASADGYVSQQRLFKPVYRGTLNLDFLLAKV